MVDVVFVLSPIESHLANARAALRAGRPTLVEKPVAASLDDILALETEATRAGVPCVPAHNYIYDPAVERARDLIAGGDLGTLCMTWITYVLHHPEPLAARYPGVLRQILPHHLYTLLYLQGMPERVSAIRSSIRAGGAGREDQVALQLEMPGGGAAHLFATFATDDRTSQPWTFIVKVLGTRGGIVHTWRDAVVERAIGTHAEAFLSYEESYVNEDNHFLTRCLRGEPPLSTLRDAARVELIIRAATESVTTRRSVYVSADAAATLVNEEDSFNGKRNTEKLSEVGYRGRSGDSGPGGMR